MGDQYLGLLKPLADMVSMGLTTWAEHPTHKIIPRCPNFDFLADRRRISPKDLASQA